MEFIIFTLIQALWFGAISWKFYVAADRKAWKAFVPVYNTFVLLRIAQRPTYWVLLYCIPVVGPVIGIVMIYELLHVFKFRKTWQTALVVGTFGIYLAYLNYYERLKYWGRDNEYIKKNLLGGINSIFFAVIVATVIRSTTFEAYTIPTSSMEKSLMVGDFLFVSKMHYGVRIPMTPLSVPLVHNTLPFLGIDSYLEWPQIPYLRLPAFYSIERGDPVVFNWPEDLDHTAIDKKQNYVKRCIGIPGDSLEIVDRIVMVNNETFKFPDRSSPQYKYYVQTNGQPFSKAELKEKFDINFLVGKEASMIERNQRDVIVLDPHQIPNREYRIYIKEDLVEEFKSLRNVVGVWPIIEERPGTPSDTLLPPGLIDYLPEEPYRLFPTPSRLRLHGERPYDDTWDNYGPIFIPKAGVTIELTPKNCDLYEKVINKHEGHKLDRRNGSVFIDGKPRSSYTFEKDYYWMMGDNRHNSGDSRDWGYVPEDHIVGKPVFIWMSWDKYKDGFWKVRNERVFTLVNGEGERKSYFWHFVGVIVFYQLFVFIRRRRKA
jgi:signal peptidase I